MMSTSTKKSSKYIPHKKPKTAFKNVLTKGRDTQRRRYGKLNVVRWLLWQDNMPALERSHNGSLALHYASARGCLECVRTLIETCPGFSANSQMENAVTPVYLAAQEGHLDVLRYLVLEAGGSLYLRAKDGMAPVHAAAQMGCLSCLKWMIQEQGIDPNMKDNDGATPVHFAASRGHIETLRWLLRHGAKITVDKYGKSPLHDAAENEQMECLAILIQHGADPRALEEYQFTNSAEADVRQRCICHQHKPRTNSSDSSPPSSPPYSEGDFEFNNSYDNIHTNNHATPQPPFYLHSQNKHHHHVVNNAATASASPNETNSRGQKQPFYLHEPGHVNTDRLKELFKNGETSTEHTNGVNSTSGFSHKVENTKHTANSNANVPAKDHVVTASILVKADIHHSSDESMSLSDMSEPGIEQETNKEEQPYPPGIDELIKTLGANTTKKPLCVSKSAAPLTHLNRTPPDGDSSEDLDGLCPDALRDAKQALRKTNLTTPKTTVFVSKSLPMQEQKEQEPKNAKPLNRQSSLPNGLPAPPPPPPLPPVSETAEETMASSPEAEIKHLPSEIKALQSESESKALHRHASMPILNNKDDDDTASNDGDIKIDDNHVIPKHIQMLQKQMALPFIPPKFPNPTQSDCLIKPSEYLRTISGRAKPKNGKNARECDNDDQPVSLHSSTSHDSGLDTASSCSSASTPGAPPPPPLPNSDIDGKSTVSSISTMMSTNTPPPSSATSCHSSPAATLAQPLAAISLNDLQKIQLKRTDSPRDSADLNQNPKDELIAELKMSKDIHGVRKLKEERAKQEEEKEKTLQAELNRQFTADNFVDNVPGVDSSGVPIPPWKRQMLAKKAAERAKKEAEELRVREAEEKRINAIPPWKRQLLQRKEQEYFKDGKPMLSEQPYYSSRPSSALSDYTTFTNDSEPEKRTVEDRRENETEDYDNKPQNPWHFQLRKTNSKLFLNG